jgi:lysophospholipase L1-like esterase
MVALVPNAKQQFLDASGVPLALGTITFYIPGTTTPKDTWQDNQQAAKNANPLPLDAAGRALIFGVGDYRQIVKDSNGVTIWDQVTSAPPSVPDVTGVTATAVAAAATATTQAGIATTQATLATKQAGAAAISAVTVNSYPNSAATNVPKGAISFSFTAGTGGTNSINNLATFTGGTLTNNPVILYDVVGAVVTNVRMTFGGLYIGSATPTMPTVVLANGGTGTITLVGGLLFAVGQGYWVQAADGLSLTRYSNVAGVATIDNTVGPLGTQTAFAAALTNVNAAGATQIAGIINLAATTTIAATAVTTVSKTASTNIVSSIVLTADPDLQMPISANQTIKLRALIDYSASTTGNIQYTITGPATPTDVQITRRAIAPGGTMTGDVTLAFGSAVTVAGGTGSGTIEVSAIIRNGANAGSVGLSWAQGTSDTTATIVKAGSTFEAIALPYAVYTALANVAVAGLGAFPLSNGGGHNYSTLAAYTRVETVAVGSKCEAQVYSFGSTTYTVTVDGVVSIITPSSGWSWMTLYSGLSNTGHRVRLEGNTQATLDTDAVFRVTGTTSAFTRPTDLPTFYVLGSAPFSTYGAIDGCKDLNTNIYPSPYQRAWSTGGGWGLRFKATTTTIRLWIYNSGTSTGALAVLQDGTQIATLTPSGTAGAYDVVTVASGLSGSHEYEIKNITGGKVNYIYALLVDSLDTVTHAAKNIEANYGDSIAAEIVNATVSADTRLGDAYKVALANGTVSVLCGTGGAQVSTVLRDGTAVISSIPLGSASVSRVWVIAGTNDMYAASAQTGGTLSATIAAFQADYQTMLANIRTAAPSAKIYAQGIYDTTRTPGNISAFRSAISAAVAARVTAGDANVVYRDMAGVINPATDTDDGLHPNTTGYAKLATYKLANL